MAAHIGAYAYSYALGAYLSVSTVDYISLANTQATLVNQFSIAIDDCTIADSAVVSSEYCCIPSVSSQACWLLL